MKTLAILYVMLCGKALAFDPAGPPPERTFEWTVRSLTHATIPRVEFDATPVLDAVAFAGLMEVPKAYKVDVQVSDEEGLKDKIINLKAENITQMELLAAIAAQAGLDILIQPGKVQLVPRK